MEFGYEKFMVRKVKNYGHDKTPRQHTLLTEYLRIMKTSGYS